MSDNWIKVLPTKPDFVPSESARIATVSVMRELAPAAESLSAVEENQVVFVDAGENFESVSCPGCSARLDKNADDRDSDDRWWLEAMEAAYASEFADLGVQCPMCGLLTNLNDLIYDWPQGFARWRIEAMNPDIGPLRSEDIDRLAAALGHPVRIVYTHI